MGEPKTIHQSTSAVQIFVYFFPEDAIDVITGIVVANTSHLVSFGGPFLKINRLLLNLFVGLNNHSGTPLLFSVDSRTRMSSYPS